MFDKPELNLKKVNKNLVWPPQTESSIKPRVTDLGVQVVKAEWPPKCEMSNISKQPRHKASQRTALQ